MKLYEFQGKQLFSEYGIAVPNGVLIESLEGLEEKVARFDTAFVKAQLLQKDRKKKNVVLECMDNEEIIKSAKKLYHRTVGNEIIKKILVEQGIEKKSEAYLSIIDKHGPVMLASTSGGSGIEGRIKTFAKRIDILDGIGKSSIEEFLYHAGFKETTPAVADVALKLYKLYSDYDALLAEVNPLVITPDNKCVGVDSKMEIDPEALYRHEELPVNEELTLLQAEALENDRRDTSGAAGRMFHEIPDGNILVFAAGGGMSIVALDELYWLEREYEGRGFKGKNNPARPAVFTEHSGNPVGDKVKGLMKTCLKYDSGIRGVWVIGGRANFTNIHETLVNGAVPGMLETQSFHHDMPIVVRRAGPEDARAFEALRAIKNDEGLNMHLSGVGVSVGDSAGLIARLVEEEMAVNGGFQRPYRKVGDES